MTVSIGIRAAPKEIYYAVLQEHTDAVEVITSSKLIIPAALELPEKLKFVRTTFLDIITEYEVSRAGIRVTEAFAQTENTLRLSFEAIIQELLASSTVRRYFVGQISNISAKLNIPRDDFSSYVSGAEDFDRIDEWGTFNKSQRESLLVGLAALTL